MKKLSLFKWHNCSFLDFGRNLLLFLTLVNNRRMSSKIHSKPRKEIQTDNKKVQHLERIRIIQDNLVFVSGLPVELADTQLLKNEVYFGRYGKVLKVVINSPPGFRKNSVAQAYVTYASELQASLAIVALDSFMYHQDRPLKVSYGTTKYCTHFLRGYQCLNSECFYLHKTDRSREVVNGDPKNNFQQQNERAFDVVSEHLEQVIKKLIDEGDKNLEQGFPSLNQMVDFLMESKLISKSEVDKLLKKHQTQVPQKLQTTASSPPAAEKRIRDDSPIQTKLTKCNSLSTMASPTKSQIEQKIAQKTKKSQMLEKSQKTQKKSSQQQQSSHRRKEALQQKIEKMIIKKVFVAGTQKSRLSFANQNSTSHKQPQQLNKLKGIVQKYLIATN